MNKNIAILGSGFSSLAAACYLAQAGNMVTIYEKNKTIGGRARQIIKDENPDPNIAIFLFISV